METHTERGIELISNSDGSIRNCPTNKAKMGFWWSLKTFHGYKGIISASDLRDIRASFAHLIAFAVIIILFPVLPLIRCFMDVRQSKSEVALYEARKERFKGGSK